jgi:kynureninase
MPPEFRANAGAAGWAVSNPSIFASAPLIASLELFQEAGIERLRQKSVELTGYLEFLLDLLGADVQLITPRDADARGAQLSFRIVGAGRGAKVYQWLTANAVACDLRGPDVIRAAPLPLYNSFVDVFRFGGKLKQALELTR